MAPASDRDGGAPAVSVVIPTRDRPNGLERALRSCLAQNLAVAEVIVVDDGSVPPAEVLANPRVRLLRIAEPVGPARARNIGLAACSTEFVAFLDDDDIWRPELLERLAGALQSAGDGAIAAGGGFAMWDGTTFAGSYLPPPGPVLLKDLLAIPVFAPSVVLARRGAVVDAGGFDERLVRCEDWSLWLRLAAAGDFIGVATPLADRAVRPAVPLRDLAALRRFERLVIAPAVAELPKAEQRRVRHRHRLQRGVLSAQAGDRRLAARLLLGAWSAQPTAYLQIGRLLTGERLWNRARALRAQRHPPPTP